MYPRLQRGVKELEPAVCIITDVENQALAQKKMFEPKACCDTCSHGKQIDLHVSLAVATTGDHTSSGPAVAAVTNMDSIAVKYRQDAWCFSKI